MSTFDKFLRWESASRDTIDFKKIYVDMTGDLLAGLLLSQIVYWYLPDRLGQSKLRVKKDDNWWVVRRREEWWDEVRISPKQFDRAAGILLEKGLIIKDYFRFGGMRTMHIRLNYDAFMRLWSEQIAAQNPVLPKGKDRPPVLPKGEDRSSPKGKTGLDERVRPLTENTTETTTESADPPDSQSRDYADDILNRLGIGVSEWSGANPADQWIRYGQAFEKIYHESTGRTLTSIERDMISDISGADNADPKRWVTAISEAQKHWTGNAQPSLARYIEYYNAGGTHADWQRWKNEQDAKQKEQEQRSSKPTNLSETQRAAALERIAEQEKYR